MSTGAVCFQPMQKKMVGAQDSTGRLIKNVNYIEKVIKSSRAKTALLYANGVIPILKKNIILYINQERI